VHWLEVLAAEDPDDPAIMLAANDSGLIHRSVDDGASWGEPAGLLEDAHSNRRLLMSSDGSDTLLLLACNSEGCALQRSEDRGASFATILDLGDAQGDLWTPRDGASELYLADGRSLWFSDDMGDSWTERGVIHPDGTRAELTGSEAGAPRLYAIVGGDGGQLFRSDDAGASWRFMTAVSDYWGSLNASQLDPDLFAWGGVEVYRSADGGVVFEVVNAWWEYYGDPANLLHADIPGLDLVVDETGQEIWYICTDGGLYRSLDGLQSVENLSLEGLRVGQYYDIHTSVADPTHIAAGSQDQGYQITATMEQPGGELSWFEQIISGDYGHLSSGDGTHEVVYSVYPGFILAQVGEEDPWLAYGDFPPGESYVPWLPPVVADPYDNWSMFFAASKLYKYTLLEDGGWHTQQWSDDSLALSSGEYVSALAFSPIDPERAWLATSSGRMYVSGDHGVSWTQSHSRGPDENWYYGQGLTPSIVDVDTAWVAGSGYGGVPAVYRTRDGGVSWEPWGDGLPDTMGYCLCQAPDGSDTLLVGTESSVYRRDAEGDAWYDVTGADAPLTTYWSCETLWHENTVRFGTYGRGIWDYQLDPDHEGCYPVQDYDGDGVDCELDCDDHDPAVSPEAEEICGDGIDNDCDGVDTPCDEPEDSDPPEDTEAPDDPDDEDPDPVEPVEPSGRCGCVAPAGPVSGVALLTVVAGAAVRRRRETR